MLCFSGTKISLILSKSMQKTYKYYAIQSLQEND